MQEILSSLWSNDLYRKIVLTVFIVPGQSFVRRLVLLMVVQRLREESPYLYTIRKATSYVITIIGLILIFGVWVERLGDLSVALGLLAAGLAFALQEVIGRAIPAIRTFFLRRKSSGARPGASWP